MPADHIWHFLLALQALDRAIALRLGDRDSRGLLPEPLDTAMAERFRDWWMISAHWPPAPGCDGAYGIEAVDTDDGLFFFFQAEDGIRDGRVTGVQTCALPI